MSIEILIALGALALVAIVAIVVVLMRDKVGPKPTPVSQPAPQNRPAKPDDSIPLSGDQHVMLTRPGGSPFRVQKTNFLIGRAPKDGSVAPDLDLGPFCDKYASRNHAKIYLDPTTRQWAIVDLGSLNGTFVNERQIAKGEVHILRHRDRISFTDRFEVVFEDPKSSDTLPVVKDYRIIELIAKGGMAAVYKANAASGDLVAIKVPVDYGEDPQLSANRLQDEFDILKRLNSRRTARAVEFARCNDGRPALIMEFLHGDTLRSHLQNASFSPPEALMIGAGIADGLSSLHAIDRVHCDLKPDNIMMRQKAHSASDVASNAVVIDFGIAMQNRTMMRNVFGSANYQSPEHILGQQLTLKSDVYSLGCMLYEMLANSRLYPDAKEVKDIKEFQVNRMPTHVIEQARNNGRVVPDEVGKLVMLMLEKSPNVRPDLTLVVNELAKFGAKYAGGRA